MKLHHSGSNNIAMSRLFHHEDTRSSWWRHQVINLLKDMSAQLEKEAKEDQEVFEKVSWRIEVLCVCDEVSSKKGQSGQQRAHSVISRLVRKHSERWNEIIVVQKSHDMFIMLIVPSNRQIQFAQLNSSFRRLESSFLMVASPLTYGIFC